MGSAQSIDGSSTTVESDSLASRGARSHPPSHESGTLTPQVASTSSATTTYRSTPKELSPIPEHPSSDYTDYSSSGSGSEEPSPRADPMAAPPINRGVNNNVVLATSPASAALQTESAASALASAPAATSASQSQTQLQAHANAQANAQAQSTTTHQPMTQGMPTAHTAPGNRRGMPKKLKLVRLPEFYRLSLRDRVIFNQLVSLITYGHAHASQVRSSSSSSPAQAESPSSITASPSRESETSKTSASSSSSSFLASLFPWMAGSATSSTESQVEARSATLLAAVDIAKRAAAGVLSANEAKRYAQHISGCSLLEWISRVDVAERDNQIQLDAAAKRPPEWELDVIAAATSAHDFMARPIDEQEYSFAKNPAVLVSRDAQAVNKAIESQRLTQVSLLRKLRALSETNRTFLTEAKPRPVEVVKAPSLTQGEVGASGSAGPMASLSPPDDVTAQESESESEVEEDESEQEPAQITASRARALLFGLLMQLDSNLKQWHGKLVPARLTEKALIKNYVSHLKLMLEDMHNGDVVRVPSPSGSTTTAPSQPQASRESEAPTQSAGQAETKNMASSLTSTTVHGQASTVTLSAPPLGSYAPMGATPPTVTITRDQLLEWKYVTLPADLPIAQVNPLASSIQRLIATQAKMQVIVNPGQEGELPSLRLPAVRHVRWGIVGCGRLVELVVLEAIQKLTPNATVTAICPGEGRSPSAAYTLAQRYRVAQVFLQPSALVADPSVDAVYFAVPPSAQNELSKLCAALNKPCVFEKPLGRHFEEAKQLQEWFKYAAQMLAEKKQQQQVPTAPPLHPALTMPLFVANPLRTLEKVQAARVIVRNMLGTIQSVRYNLAIPESLLHDPRVRYGKYMPQLSPVGHSTLAPRAASSAASTKPDWTMDASVSGGGPFVLYGALVIDVLEYIFGSVGHIVGDAVRVSSSSTQTNQSQSPNLPPLENLVTFTFRYVNQAHPPSTSATAPAPVPPGSGCALGVCSFNFAASRPEESFEVQGSEGTLRMNLILGPYFDSIAARSNDKRQNEQAPIYQASSRHTISLTSPDGRAVLVETSQPIEDNAYAGYFSAVSAVLQAQNAYNSTLSQAGDAQSQAELIEAWQAAVNANETAINWVKQNIIGYVRVMMHAWSACL